MPPAGRSATRSRGFAISLLGNPRFSHSFPARTTHRSGRAGSTGELQFPRPLSHSIPAERIFASLICPRQELNLHHLLRREIFYPLNYGSVVSAEGGI